MKKILITILAIVIAWGGYHFWPSDEVAVDPHPDDVLLGSVIAFVNRAEVYVNTGVAPATPAISHTTGNFLAVYLMIQNGDTPTVTDTASNTYVAAGGSVTTAVTNRLWIFYAYNITGNASNVVTAHFTSPSGYQAMSVRQFSGVETASDPLDDNDGATGSGGNISTPSLTLTAAEGVIFAVMEGDGRNFVAGTNYTLNPIVDGFGNYTADEYHIVTASEAATATQDSGGVAWGMKSALFKAAAGGTPTPIPFRRRNIIETRLMLFKENA